MDTGTDIAAMDSMERMNRSAWKNFERELQSLEDYLASKNHTLLSASEFFMQEASATGKSNVDRELAGRKIAELYRFREFLSQQYSIRESGNQDTALSPSRLRRLARV
jgi:hypothetical protein